jgi:NAD(P)-dependent dehydrogenase (short-subunit alcohol dehydrogenase family)
VAWEDHLAQLEFFVKSPVLLGRAVVPAMQARGFGRIIQVDSEVVDRPPPGRSAYVTAKSAQIGLTRSWARELAHFGITVNTVGPGFIPVERHADVRDEIKAAYLATVPACRMGTPEDIAHAVSFLPPPPPASSPASGSSSTAAEGYATRTSSFARMRRGRPTAALSSAMRPSSRSRSRCRIHPRLEPGSWRYRARSWPLQP